MAQYYDVDALKKYIVANAPRYGLDPATALKVWTGEGLKEGIWQSNIVKNGKREPSYGPFQFFMGGGMGNDFLRDTKLDPRDPKNVYAMADYAMAHAGKNGWGAWYAARDQGISPWQGIAKGTSMPGPTDDPSIVAQNVGGFQLPHMPNLDPMPGMVNVESAAGPPPDPNSQQMPTGIIDLLGKTMTEKDPAIKQQLLSQLHKSRFGITNPSDAYRAQGLEDKGFGSLRYWFS